MAGPALQGIHLVSCEGTTIAFDEARFAVTRGDNSVTIAADDANQVTITLDSQEVAYESRFARESLLSEDKKGDIDFSPFFVIAWEDELSHPEVRFKVPPSEVVRTYVQGQGIELGLEDVNSYRVLYRDGVEAVFERKKAKGFDFSFSTGFRGSFWKDPDGSYTVKFKGDRLKPTEEAYRSQSKFIVSRSKYSGNLLLVLEDDATVHLA
jgi:hypothetical protein